MMQLEDDFASLFVNHNHPNNNNNNNLGNFRRFIQNYVKPSCRPGNLCAFDCQTRKDDKSVPISPSERACALSHIACWMSFSRHNHDNPSLHDNNDNLYMHHTIAGYASGPCFHRPSDSHSNVDVNMPPQPVILVL